MNLVAMTLVLGPSSGTSGVVAGVADEVLGFRVRRVRFAGFSAP